MEQKYRAEIGFVNNQNNLLLILDEEDKQSLIRGMRQNEKISLVIGQNSVLWVNGKQIIYCKIDKLQ